LSEGLVQFEDPKDHHVLPVQDHALLVVQAGVRAHANLDASLPHPIDVASA
jgi:hypothetical protein